MYLRKVGIDISFMRQQLRYNACVTLEDSIAECIETLQSSVKERHECTIIDGLTCSQEDMSSLIDVTRFSRVEIVPLQM